MKNNFRKMLSEKKLALGAWMQIGHPAIAEIFARRGLDWICVDLEHGSIEIETMANIFRAVEKFESVPVARIPANDPVWIHRALDAGAKGLLIPMVKTSREAEFAVREAKYPPLGTRGFGYSRANNHGVDFDEYMRKSNEEIAMIMQIEHIDAIENISKILAVDHVDGVFIGPLDLSGSMGILGQLEHPDFLKALEKFAKAGLNSGKSFGAHILRPGRENVEEAVESGFNLIALGMDNIIIDEAVKSFRKITASLPSGPNPISPPA